MSSQVAEDALMSIFVTRPEVLQDIEFEGEYLRSFISYQQSAHAIFRRILDDFDTWKELFGSSVRWSMYNH